jgi:hypothetical protein
MENPSVLVVRHAGLVEDAADRRGERSGLL